MKISRILSFLVLFIFPGTSCFSQDEIPDSVISVSFTNRKLEACLVDISNQTGLYMAYKTSLIDTIFVRSFHTPKMKLDLVLDSFLTACGLDYKYKNRQLFIKKLPAAETLKGIILNATDSLPIPYASLSLFGTSQGTISDFKGVYEWELSSRYMNDTALISSLGFERRKICLRELKNTANNLVYLSPELVEIEPVVVHRKLFVSKILGNRGNRSNGSIYIDTHGQQTALLVRSEKGTRARLNSVSYYLSPEGNTRAPYRIRIYAADSSIALPDADLINEIIVAKPTGVSGWHTTKLSNYNVEITEAGIFIALEGIFPNDYDYYLGDADFIDIQKIKADTSFTEDLPLSISYGQRLGYNRKEAENTWHYSLSHTWFQLRKQQFGVMIRANVQLEKAKKKKRRRRHDE